MDKVEEIVKALFGFRYAISDNLIFKLHYRCTVLILVVFSFVITCRLVLGDSFDCSSRDLSEKFIETYCYAEGTHIIGSSFNKIVGEEVPYPGIDKYKESDIIIPLKFYSWVNLVFLVQAFNFYLPHLLWKFHEQGLISRLSLGLETFIVDEEKKNLNLCVLAKYLACTHGKHVVYTCVYILCETLNFLIDILQYVWLLYFFKVIGVSSELKDVPMDTWEDFSNYYFPLSSKCSMSTFGSSGHVQRLDILCTLPLNRLYMYMFLFLNAWYVLLAVLSSGVLTFRLLLIIPPVRYLILTTHAPLVDRETLSLINARSSICDWFFLSRLQKNLLPTHFEELLTKFGAISQNANSPKNYNTFEQSDNL